LFSPGGQTETPCRNQLSDDFFERLLLLKANIKGHDVAMAVVLAAMLELSRSTVQW